MKEELCNRLLKEESFRLLIHRYGQDPDDILQEVALILCEKDDKELANIANCFKFYISRTIMNLCSYNGPIGKLKRRRLEADKVIESLDNEYDYTIDERYYEILKQLAALPYYERELFKAYVEEGSLRKLQDATAKDGLPGIPYSSIHKTVTKVRNIIKDNQ